MYFSVVSGVASLSTILDIIAHNAEMRHYYFSYCHIHSKTPGGKRPGVFIHIFEITF